MIKLASYNIHKGVGTDRRRDPLRIIEVLNEIDADMVALQEADMRFGSREAILHPLLLDNHSNYRAVPLDVQGDSMGWHGNVVLVRKQADVLASDILHIPCLEPRGAVMAQVEHKGIAITLFGMHLDLSGLWRRRQSRAIIDMAAPYCEDGAVVLMGDMNEWRPASGCLADFGKHYSSAPCGKSFHARGPIGSLDKIFHSGRLKRTACGVHMSAQARKASDHLPVWAEFEIE